MVIGRISSFNIQWLQWITQNYLGSFQFGQLFEKYLFLHTYTPEELNVILWKYCDVKVCTMTGTSDWIGCFEYGRMSFVPFWYVFYLSLSNWNNNSFCYNSIKKS